MPFQARMNELYDKVREVYSLEYTDFLEVFLPHHKGHCCTDIIWAFVE
jgi:hypothetical protein